MITKNIYYRSESKDKSTGYIWIKFYVAGEKVNFSTKVSCMAEHWNDEKKIIRSSDKDAKDKNLIIENVKKRVTDVEVKFKLSGKKMTRATFMKMYYRPDDYNTFFDFCKDYQKELSKYLESGTIKNHNKAIEKLRSHNPELTFDDITFDFLTTYFNAVLIKQTENKLSTAYKDMACLKRYIRAAIRKGYMDENPFSEFKIRKVDCGYEYLEKHELEKLLNLYYSGSLDMEKHKTLQFMLYMCFSSQHVTDGRNTNIEDIGPEYLTYYRIKTKNKKPERIEIAVTQMLRNIITDAVGYRKHGPVFTDLPADQTMNKYLKAICAMKGIEIHKNISTKCGRHTFATFYLQQTRDLNGLKKLLGHSDIRETLKYAHVMEADLRQNMKCFDTFNQKVPHHQSI